MLVIGVRHKPVKMTKVLIVFPPPFGLNDDYGWNFKGCCPSVNEGAKWVQLPYRPRKLWCHWPHSRILVGTWGISLAVKPEIMGVGGANVQWGHSVCPSPSQKRESIAFDLIPWSAWGSSSPRKQVGRSSTPSQVWGRESKRWPKYMQWMRQCWKWEEFWKTRSVL